MSANTQQKYKVGIFVITGFVLSTFAVLFLGGSRSFFTQTSMIHGKFENVVGLNVGSVVSLAGIPIGNVHQISFQAEDNKLDLEMKVDTSYLSRLTEGTSVEIRTQGALGDKFVYIIPGDPKNKVLASDHIVLEANKGGDFLGMLAERSGEASHVFDVINEAQKLLKNLNESSKVDKVLSNFLETSQQMSKAANDVRLLISEATPKLKSSSDKMDRILEKIDSGEGTLGALINDPTIHDQLKSLLGGSTQKKTIKSLLRNSIEKAD